MFKKWSIRIAVAATVLMSTVTAASAQIYNGWDYAIDSQNDGSGGPAYEMRGLAFRFSGNTATFAVSSGLPLGGNAYSGARNGRIDLGDLYLNFTGHSLTTVASFGQPGVFGIRFDSKNDSLGNLNGSNPTVGIFKNLTVASFTTANAGYATLQDYLNAGFGRTTQAMGDLQSSSVNVASYLGTGTMYPNISSGTQIGSTTLLTGGSLSAMGLDFAHFGADPADTDVFGFSFDRSLLPTGDFTGHLFEECINDGVSIKGANVPEPPVAAVAGSAAAGFGLLLLRRRRHA